MKLSRQEIKDLNSENHDATLLNDDTDDDQFSLDIGNKDVYGDRFQTDSNSEDEERSFAMRKDGETI